MSKICENSECDVLCGKNQAFILDKAHNVVAVFEKNNGLYVSTVEVQNPKHPDFTGQGR